MVAHLFFEQQQQGSFLQQGAGGHFIRLGGQQLGGGQHSTGGQQSGGGQHAV